MNRNGKTFIFMMLILLGGLLGAQPSNGQLVFSYLGIDFTTAGEYGATEVQLLENRLKSYLLELARQENYSVTAPREAPALRALLAESSARYRDYLANNRRSTSQGLVVLKLSKTTSHLLQASIHDPDTGDILFSVRKSYADFDRLLEDSRQQIYELFGLDAPQNGAIVQAGPLLGAMSGGIQRVSMGDIAGMWQGDFDLGQVSIAQDGTGTAVLANNERMKIRATINGSTIVIQQDEPNSPRLYVGTFPLSLAGQIARLARPMSWEFTINSAKDQLTGKKNTSNFTFQKGQIIQTDNTYSREAVWTRIP